MAKNTNQEATDRNASTETQPEQDAASQQVQERVNQEQEQGFRGVEVDPTPNENYTVQGVTSGAPTPETDAEAARAAREATGLGLTRIEAAERDRRALEGR